LATGQYQQAVDRYLEAIAQQEAQDSSSAIMECYYSIGYAYLQMGRMHEFVQFEAKIEPYLDLLDDYTADVMVALGSSHRNLDHLQQAINYYQQAIDRCPEDDPDYYPTLSAAYNNSGIVYRHLGDTERSRLHYQQALRFYQKAPLNYARTLGNIGQLYRSEGKLQEAQSSYQQALDTLLAHPNLGLHTRSVMHDNLALLLDEQGDYQAALGQLDRAKRFLEAGHPFWANIWRHYAQIYRHLGEYGFAERYIEKSQTLREAQYPHRHYSRAALHQDRAQLLADFGEFEKSLGEWQQSMYHLTGDFAPQSLTALPSLQGISYPQEMLESLQQKALSWQGLAAKSGTLQYREEANRTYQLATKLADTLRVSYWGEEAKLLLSSAIVPLYEAAIQNALHLYEATQSEQWLREAYYFAAKNKAAILREQIREEQAGQVASIPDSLLIAQREVRYRLAQVEQMLLTYPDSVSFQEKRFRLYERQRVIQDRIEAAYPEYLQLQREAVFTRASVVQAQL
ncbi:MAG: tetratricopeptide repeat protein, partial [Bacteroidota bacterium]